MAVFLDEDGNDWTEDEVLMGNEINCTIRVRLTKPAPEVMENASRIGRDCGRDVSWKPADLNAAIAEILLWSDDHLGLGVEIIQD